MTLINEIKNNSRKILHPYTHWEIDKPLSEEMLKEICQTKISDAPRLYDGTRAADKTGDGLDGTLRYYLDKNNIHQHPALKLLVDELLNNESVKSVSESPIDKIKLYLEFLLYLPLFNAGVNIKNIGRKLDIVYDQYNVPKAIITNNLLVQIIRER